MPPQPIRYASLRPTTRGSQSLRRSRPTRLTSIGAWQRVIGRMFSMALARSVYDDAPDAFAFVHQVEPLVDVRQRHGVGDHRIDLDLALHVPIDDFGHVGAAARAAECRSLPHIAGAIEGVVGAADLVGAALCHVDEVRDQIAADLFRIDEMRYAKAFAPLL